MTYIVKFFVEIDVFRLHMKKKSCTMALTYRYEAEKSKKSCPQISPIAFVATNVTEKVITKNSEKKHDEDQDQHHVDKRLLHGINQRC